MIKLVFQPMGFWTSERYNLRVKMPLVCSVQRLEWLPSSYLIYPLTVRVVWAPQMISQPFPPFFPVFHCPLGLSELQACPFPNVVFPHLPLSALSSSPFHCALQDGFGKTWWMGDLTIPLQFSSLYGDWEVFVWSNCLLDLGVDFLFGNMVFVWDV